MPSLDRPSLDTVDLELASDSLSAHVTCLCFPTWDWVTCAFAPPHPRDPRLLTGQLGLEEACPASVFQELECPFPHNSCRCWVASGESVSCVASPRRVPRYAPWHCRRHGVEELLEVEILESSSLLPAPAPSCSLLESGLAAPTRDALSSPKSCDSLSSPLL